MLKFLNKWIRRQQEEAFRSAYITALESRKMPDRLEAAQFALEIVDELEPWPLSETVPKNRAIGKLHGALARTYMDLGIEDPPRYSSLALEAANESLKYLTPADGPVWAVAITNLSIIYADRLDGNRAENIEKAIEAAEAALEVLNRERDSPEWINAMANLGGYYAERERGNRAENIEISIRCFEEVLEEEIKNGSPLAQARVMIGLGASYADSRKHSKEHNIEKAIECLEKARDLLSEDETPSDWATVHRHLSEAYQDRILGNPSDNIRNALDANDKCRAVLEKLRLWDRWAATMMTRMRLLEACPYGDRGSNLREALRAGDAALQIFTADDYPEKHDLAIQSLNNVRRLLFDDNRADTLEDIIRQSESALQVVSPESDAERCASLLVTLGNAYAERINGDRSENLERSITLLEKAVALTDQYAKPVPWGITMNGLAQSYMERTNGLMADNIEYAMALCEAALVVVSNQTDPDEHSAILETLGEGYTRRIRGDRIDNLTRALQIYETADQRRDKKKNPESWLRLEQKYLQAEFILNSLTPLRSSPDAAPDGQEPLDAEKYLKSLRISAAIVSVENDPRTWMAAHLFLADTYTRVTPQVSIDDVVPFTTAIIANCQEAVDIYESMLPVTRRLGDKNQEAILHSRIGVAYGLMYIFADARKKSASENSDTGHRYAHERRKYYKYAVAAHTAALEIETIENFPRKHLKTALSLGRLNFYERDWSAADKWFTSAAAAANQILGDIELSESDMKDVLGDLGAMAALGPYVSLMLDKPSRALELAESGRARLLAKALTLESLPMSSESRSKVHGIQNKISVHERRLSSPMLFDRITPFKNSVALRREIRSLVEEADLARSFENSASIALEEILTNGSVIVIPVLTEAGGRIVISLLRDGKPEIHVAESKAVGTVREIIESSGNGIEWRKQYLRFSDGIPDEALFEAGKALGEVFATPLSSALESLGVPPGTHLDILPQGALGILPLALARDDISGKLLLDQYEFSLSPSLTVLRQANRRAAAIPRSLMAFAYPEKNRQDELQFAETELELLRSWFSEKGSWFSNDGNWKKDFEERYPDPAEIIKVLPGKDIWHFATHGSFYPPDPLRSGLDLGRSSRLTLEKLFETSGLGTPRLVVLSACDTGLYDLTRFPDEFIGLPSGFLQAGAAGVIATLWPVEDLSTALLVGRFYEGYLDRRLKPSSALRAAQLWLRNAPVDDVWDTLTAWKTKGYYVGDISREFLVNLGKERDSDCPFSSPLYWGGFVHYGV